jgi:hypothetical protein
VHLSALVCMETEQVPLRIEGLHAYAHLKLCICLHVSVRIKHSACWPYHSSVGS